MRSRRAALALAAVALLAAGHARAVVNDPSCATVPIVVRSSAVTYTLPWTFLRAGTDSAWTRSGALVRGRDYALDPLRGELRLLRALAPNETLWVAACRLLQPPPLDFARLRYRPAPATTAPAVPDTGVADERGRLRPAVARDPATALSGAQLAITGNKTLAVDFGSSQDAALRQSLDLAVSGTLAPGVELTGVLSDRNTPLSASGSTQDLQSLDRVLIELRAPQGSAALGDVPLTLERGEFGRLERRLQGARGEWRTGAFQGTVAAASAQGEYFRMQFFGADGLQGPYTLTDRDGVTGVQVVPGSEVVTVDGQRMVRGESADFAIDYERARVTFSNRRPITSASRITVEYQYAVNRFRRNFAAAQGVWQTRTASAYTQFMTEGDDKGRPIDRTFDADDRVRLALAGDSASFAIGAGVTPGVGDYDTVRVSPTELVFGFAGRDSGDFAVSFTRATDGAGDYADSAQVSGRTVYRFVGVGLGLYRVGRALPLPESHQLWTLGGRATLGAFTLEGEGGFSHLDRNTFSSLDDGDDAGQAGRLALGVEGALPAAIGGRGGLRLGARGVDSRFAPFSRLERPFAEEDWGLPIGASLERQRRGDADGFWRPKFGGELAGHVARLQLPQGFRSWRRALEWSRDGKVLTRASWLRSDGTQDGVRFGDAGREHVRGELRVRAPWVEPALHAEADRRQFASDSGRVGDRFREWGADLAAAPALRWHGGVGFALRRDGRATGTGFEDQSEARTWRATLETPTGGPLGVALALQRRDTRPLANPLRTRSDLASLRVRGEQPKRRLAGTFNLEVTSEGENRRVRSLVFVGTGRGAYDAFGNFVGTGDYDLVVTVSPDLDRVARAAASGRAAWQFGTSETWRGSRLEFNVETEARRRGALRFTDLLVSPAVALGDAGLSRGAIAQRLETELAPDSKRMALRLRAERRASSDRSFQNFEQTLDQRTLNVRWRARPGTTVTTELEGRLEDQAATQTISFGGTYRRRLANQGVQAQLVVTPQPSFRIAGVVDAARARPEGQDEYTRTLRIGPDLGFALGSRGRAELSGRRAFTSGPPAVGLLPSVDPAGAPRWEGSSHVDFRVRESTTFGVSSTVRERPGKPTLVIGRAELRAFF